jgi:hypothetical protein
MTSTVLCKYMFVNDHRLAHLHTFDGSMCDTLHLAVELFATGSHKATLFPPLYMSTISESTISPSEEDLKAAVASLKKEHPALGIAKLHALLLSENPSWAVSEKRLRRILKNSNPDDPLAQHQGLECAATGTPRRPGPSSSPSTTGSKTAHVYPSSTLVEGLAVSRWTTTIEVKYFDRKKGKGLVAKEPISEGQVVWKEDPFIIAPEW